MALWMLGLSLPGTHTPLTDAPPPTPPSPCATNATHSSATAAPVAARHPPASDRALLGPSSLRSKRHPLIRVVRDWDEVQSALEELRPQLVAAQGAAAKQPGARKS
jgi:hypothetical protein